MSLVSEAPLMAFKNKVAVTAAAKCGCYKCLQAFCKEDIKQWTDNGQTALCPKCGTDAVVPMTNINEQMLQDMHQEWFTKKTNSRR